MCCCGDHRTGLDRYHFAGSRAAIHEGRYRTDGVALGHTGGAGIALGGFVARLTRSKKNPSKSTEDIKFPAGLGFLRDTTVLIALSMAVIYVIVALFAGAGYIEENLSDGQNFLVFSVLQAATFSAGVFIILAGVRVVLGEIVPAFKGISEKLVKNAVPALDVPMTFTFAPNAVLIGFISSFVGGLIGMGIMILAGTTIIIPGIVAHFMTGGATGVIGNGQGGSPRCHHRLLRERLGHHLPAAVPAAGARRYGLGELHLFRCRLRCGWHFAWLHQSVGWSDCSGCRRAHCSGGVLPGILPADPSRQGEAGCAGRSLTYE